MDLIHLYQTNIQQIYGRIKQLYSQSAIVIDQDYDTPSLTLLPFSGDKLNRQAYLWTLQCIDQLETTVNELVTAFNNNEIIDYDVGDTIQLKLWKPESLVIDNTYLTNLKNDFSECNKLIDQLTTYLQPFLAGR